MRLRQALAFALPVALLAAGASADTHAADAAATANFLKILDEEGVLASERAAFAPLYLKDTSGAADPAALEDFQEYIAMCLLENLNPKGRVVYAKWRCEDGGQRTAIVRVQDGKVAKIFYGPPPPAPPRLQIRRPDGTIVYVAEEMEK